MEEKKHQINWEQHLLEGKISKKEAAKFADDASFDAFEHFINEAKHLDVPRVTSKEKAWQKLEHKIAEKSSPKIISISRRNWIIGVAASFTLVIGAFFLLPLLENASSNTLFTETGLAENKRIQLPDQSLVDLNIESTVSFNEDTWSESRLLELTGEAFFEVEKGSTFSVVTRLGTISVLGTSFNVRLRNEELTVACKTGKVKVALADGSDEVIITPGQKVTIENNQLSDVQNANLNRIASWMNNEFDFEGMPMKEVFEELERQFDVRIESTFDDATLESTMTGTVSTENLKEAIRTIELMKNVKGSISADGEIVTFDSK